LPPKLSTKSISRGGDNILWVIALPAAARAMAAKGPQWAAWVDGLAGVADDVVGQWELRIDGDPVCGSASLVLPVRTADSTPAVLKVHFPDEPSEHEHLALRRWAGGGAARLLRADPRHRVVLLERLASRTLADVSDLDACEVVADLYRRLHVAALPQLRTLTSYLERWVADFEALPRSAPIPHRLVEQAAAHARDLADDATGTLIHGNLHYDTVHAAEREPWLAIAPHPVNGDPHFEVAPMLWHRWDEVAGNVRGRTQQRFYGLVDAAGLNEDRARAWVIVRIVREALTAEPAGLTKLVALAKAVQD
jgi:streptomycin 6-kinase